MLIIIVLANEAPNTIETIIRFPLATSKKNTTPTIPRMRRKISSYLFFWLNYKIEHTTISLLEYQDNIYRGMDS